MQSYYSIVCLKPHSKFSIHLSSWYHYHMSTSIWYYSIFRARHITHTQQKHKPRMERVNAPRAHLRNRVGAASCNGYYSHISNLVAAADIFRWGSQQPWPMAIRASAPTLVLKKGKIPLFPTFYNISNSLKSKREDLKTQSRYSVKAEHCKISDWYWKKQSIDLLLCPQL